LPKQPEAKTNNEWYQKAEEASILIKFELETNSRGQRRAAA